eukprot:6204201-Pleurochrysis_carterae.AAC.1
MKPPRAAAPGLAAHPPSPPLCQMGCDPAIYKPLHYFNVRHKSVRDQQHIAMRSDTRQLLRQKIISFD